MKKDTIVNDYIIRAIIEANLQSAKENHTTFSLVKFVYRIDLEDAYGFKDFIAYIHTNTNFSPILYQGYDTFLIFLKDTKILNAKTLIRELNREIKQIFRFEIEQIGITSSDPLDTYKKLMDRVNKYFVMAKFSNTKNIFYGTADFDSHNASNPINTLQNISKKSTKVTLNNIYKGIPINEDVNISGFSNGILQVRISPSMLSFYKKERFTFIQHDFIPDVIKADILTVDDFKLILILGNLEYLPISPVERKSTRIYPVQKIHAILSWNKKKILSGYILSISENATSIEVPEGVLNEKFDQNLLHKALHIQFQFVNKKNFFSLIDITAYIFSIQDNIIILNILPTADETQRIRHYIDVQQTKLLTDLKIALTQKKV